MIEEVAAHYSGGGSLAGKIAESLRRAGKNLNELKTADLATVDEFHIRGRKATLEMAEQMKLTEDSRVLDIGSGLGGPARVVSEEICLSGGGEFHSFRRCATPSGISTARPR